MNQQYQFITEVDSNPVFDNDSPLYYFYQVCRFKNKLYNKFLVRKFIINSNLDFTKTEILKLNTKEIKTLLASLNNYQYRLYETNDLNIVNYPNYNDIYMLQSDLLCKKNTGFDAFNNHFVN